MNKTNNFIILGNNTPEAILALYHRINNTTINSTKENDVSNNNNNNNNTNIHTNNNNNNNKTANRSIAYIVRNVDVLQSNISEREENIPTDQLIKEFSTNNSEKDFICKNNYFDVDFERGNIFISNKEIIRKITGRFTLTIDCTYKLMDNNFPVVVVGAIDIKGKFLCL